jgi:type II secretory pathway predicted ATPase ExeA
MKNTFFENEKYMKMFKWRENPFSLKILPELFVGYEKEVNKLIESLNSSKKFSLLIGPTGSGKTTLIKHLMAKFDNYDYIFYLSKPPKNPNDWIEIFTNFIKPSFFERLFSRHKNLNLYNLGEWVKRKTKNKSTIIFVDESHEATIDTLEWLRTLTDQVNNLSMVLAGLPTLETILKQNLETLVRRIDTHIELTNLSKHEVRELIKKRIEWAGGDDIKPFTSNTIEFVYEQTGGFPREVIRLCGNLVEKSVEKNISTIDTDFLKDHEPSHQKISMDIIDSLPYRQKTILETLGTSGELTPTEIVKKLETEGYKSKDNAIRSVNNILRRLINENLVIRKRIGKSYKYKLSDKIQTLMVNA